MMEVAQDSTAWFATGFEAALALWTWVAVVLLSGLWRSIYRPAADPIRPSGPGVG